jgi:hypothetical protein
MNSFVNKTNICFQSISTGPVAKTARPPHRAAFHELFIILTSHIPVRFDISMTPTRIKTILAILALPITTRRTNNEKMNARVK